MIARKKKPEETPWWRKYTAAHVSGDVPVLREGAKDREEERYEMAEFDPFKDMEGIFKAFLGTEPLKLKMSMRPRLLKMEGGSFREPVAKLKDTGKEIAAAIELPGCRKEDINVKIENDSLIVDAMMQKKSEKRGEGFASLSTSYNGFRRVIALPVPVEREGTRAKYENGILTVIMRKRKGGAGPSDVEVE
ncbi:MAG: Hsp20/alpha crystallin family protein [archaeon]